MLIDVNKKRCTKCEQLVDNKEGENYTLCSKCRKWERERKKKYRAQKEVRQNAMNLFRRDLEVKPIVQEWKRTEKRTEMLTEDEQKEILHNLARYGSVDKDNPVIKPYIGKQKDSRIVNTTSGAVRLHTHVVSKFKPVLNRPDVLSTFMPTEIRCCICNRTISYPAWYYRMNYAVSQFHFFICFDINSPDKPNVDCSRSNK